LRFCLSRPLHALTCHWLSKAEACQGMPRFNPISKYSGNRPRSLHLNIIRDDHVEVSIKAQRIVNLLTSSVLFVAFFFERLLCFNKNKLEITHFECSKQKCGGMQKSWSALRDSVLSSPTHHPGMELPRTACNRQPVWDRRGHSLLRIKLAKIFTGASY